MQQRSYGFIGAIALVALSLLIIYAIAALSPVNINRGLTNDETLYPPLDAPTIGFGNPSRGPRDAALTIVEFGDYSCAPCAEIEASIAAVLATHPKDVRVVWKDFPNTVIHPGSFKAAMAARCAGEQGAFWEYHDLLLQNYLSVTESNLTPFAAELKLDTVEFESCLASNKMQGLIERDFIEGQRLRIDGTPYLFVGTRRVSGYLDPEQLLGFVQGELDLLKKEAATNANTAAAPTP